jgi:acetyl-CoA C-acetyltransferase
MHSIDPRTPVLVGLGTVQQQERDPAMAQEPVQLMIAAVRAAAADCGSPGLAATAERICVPQGMWRYGDAARMVARAVGARAATTVCAKVGILQQSLIGDVCRRIAAGEIDSGIVVGGEARFRALQAQIAGVDAAETVNQDTPDEVLEPAAELLLPVETESGLGMMPVGLLRGRGKRVSCRSGPRRGRCASRSHCRALQPFQRDRRRTIRMRGSANTSRRHSRFATPSARNPMLAFPYTKLHNSSWNVDQAAALLFCSAAASRVLSALHAERWIFPRASSESNHMLALSERVRSCIACPGARIAGQRALEALRARCARAGLWSSFIPASRSRWNSTLPNSAFRREQRLDRDRRHAVCGWAVEQLRAAGDCAHGGAAA